LRHIAIIGATSAIAEACAREWATRGDQLLLVARDASRLEEVAQDLRVRSGQAAAPNSIATFVMDATDTRRIDELLAFARDRMVNIDTVLIAYGTLPDQSRCEASLDLTQQAALVNGTSTIGWMAAFARVFAQRRSGTLAVIGSPAGDRGRASNYTYGAAKSMVHTFAEGLRHRLWNLGVRVILIKPGFVDTPMTKGLKKKGPLWSSPAVVARAIVKAIDHSDGTVYVPGFWRYIMLVIRHLPWFVFRRMSI